MKRHPKAPGNYWEGYMAGMLRVIRQPMPPSWYGDRSLAWRGCAPWPVHRDVGDRCSVFHKGLSGAVCLSFTDPTMTIPEGIPYPDHGWKYVQTCTMLAAGNTGD